MTHSATTHFMGSPFLRFTQDFRRTLRRSRSAVSTPRKKKIRKSRRLVGIIGIFRGVDKNKITVKINLEMEKLKVRKENIVDEKGKEIILKGLNLGGWLLMEGYILGGRNIPEHQFKNKFFQIYGKDALKQFTKLFRENFIRESDFKIIKNLGFNCLRVPFNFRVVEGGFTYLERVVNFCRKYQIYCILDLHAAPGSQNIDWHSDSSSKALLWKDKKYQERFIHICQVIASRFKGEEAIAGFDILNEPVYKDERVILKLYKDTVKAIREIDRERIIFLEGNQWAQRVEFMGKPWDENLAYSIHFYNPLEFTFGFVRNLRYPGKIFGRYFSKENLRKALMRYYKIKKQWQVPIFVGEFGVNSRCPYCHKEFNWLKDTLDLFKEFGFSWTYWTYKAAASGIYPDGVYQYLGNPAWLSRQEPVLGWETYYRLWKRYKKDIVESWKTEEFKENKALSSLLRIK